MTGTTIRLGTRGSRLAVAQSQLVADALEEATGYAVELVPVVTHGDVSKASLAQIGGVGVFATALRQGLAAGDYDVVVHSCKDLPTAQAQHLDIAAMPERVDPRDVIVTRAGEGLSGLRHGARVGTGSTRRQAQLRRARPDVEIVDIRGNIDTRIGRVDHDLDGVIIAAAGLERLPSAATHHHEPLPIDTWVPAPAQGVLAVETRQGESDLVAALDHAPTRLVATLERAVLGGLGSGCAAPVGVYAVVASDLRSVELHARVYDLDDAQHDVAVDEVLELGEMLSAVADAATTEAWSVSEGERVAQQLIAAGAARIIAAADARRPA
ncbi:hydroxymethylbilane synthase [Pseudoclavibacter sp. 13-3]|uniref:hydroxymethylbilane synthase n=1 Tax=Pseudoclavibacter sp. 13-3 TaxID=2901228 RepID=UPI001E564A0B|nr:hydroxymethylbilane synthase [Pseudoclavibacter sp. 13-3]